MTTPFLPSTLPLLPLPPPQLLFPYLRVTVPLTTAQVSVVLKSVTDNAKVQKLDDANSRVIAVVPVIEHERRVGRWACGQCGSVLYVGLNDFLTLQLRVYSKWRRGKTKMESIR
jgi:ribosomal protein S27AE